MIARRRLLAAGAGLTVLAVQGLALAQTAAVQSKIVSFPAIGQEAEVEVGATMISTARVSELPTIRTTAAYSKGGFTVLAQEMVYAMSDSGGIYYQTKGHNVLKGMFGAQVVDGGVFVPFDQNAPTALFYYNAYGPPIHVKLPGIAYTTGSVVRTSDTDFRQELIYGGSAKGVISLTYREFQKDMARPAFTQQLTYDLADGDEIGFRGARFKVVRTTNVGMTYVVLKHLTPIG